MTEQEIEFDVLGEPVPQGSTKSFVNKKTGAVVTTHSNRNTSVWRQRIATEAQRVQKETNFFTSDKKATYLVTLAFTFTRPASVSKKARQKGTRPDLDKLIRAVLDGITDVLIKDDAKVWAIVASKTFADDGEPPGVKITVKRMD